MYIYQLAEIMIYHQVEKANYRETIQFHFGINQVTKYPCTFFQNLSKFSCKFDLGEIIYNNCLHPIPDDLSSNSSSCSSGNKQDRELYVLHESFMSHTRLSLLLPLTQTQRQKSKKTLGSVQRLTFVIEQEKWGSGSKGIHHSC